MALNDQTNLDSIQKLLVAVNKVADDFRKMAVETFETVDPAVFATPNAELSQQLYLYVALEDLLDAASIVSKMCNKNQPIVAERAEKIMTAQQMDSIEMYGKTFTPDTKTYVSVSEGNKAQVLAWLKTHETGKDLVREDFNANAFTAFIKKEVLAVGQEVPDGVTAFDKPILTVRKKRGS